MLHQGPLLDRGVRRLHSKNPFLDAVLFRVIPNPPVIIMKGGERNKKRIELVGVCSQVYPVR
jgi:hypothetical protein